MTGRASEGKEGVIMDAFCNHPELENIREPLFYQEDDKRYPVYAYTCLTKGKKPKSKGEAK